MFAINLLRKCRQFLERLKCKVNDYLRDFKWKGRIERLPLPIKIVLVFLYLSSKYAWILLKLKILPIAISGVVLSGFLSKDVSIVVAWLILCIFTYEYFPKVTAKLYGDFTSLWWVRGIFTVYASIPILLILYCDGLDIIFYFWLLLLLPLSFMFSKELLKISDMENWRGLIPRFCELTGLATYNGWNCDKSPPHPYVEISKFFLAFIPALVLIFYSMVFGIFYIVFTSSSFLLTLFVTIWLFKDIYYAVKKKSPVDSILEVISKEGDIEKKIIHPLFSSKHYTKQFVGILCISANFALTAFVVGVFGSVFSSFGSEALSNPTTETLAYWIIPILLFTPVLSHQFYFLYVIAKRFTRFLDVWTEYPKGNNSKRVDAPPILKGSTLIFTINLIFTIFVPVLWYHYYCKSNYFFGDIKLFYSLLLSSFIILSFINFLLLVSYRKRKNETITKELYKDNMRIPIILAISLITCFSAISFLDLITYDNIFLGFVVTIISILTFYMDDWERIVKAKYSKNLKKAIIANYLYLSIVPLLFFICGQLLGFLAPLAYMCGVIGLIVCITFPIFRFKCEQAEKSK